MFLDGSDVGLGSTDLNALYVEDDGSILISPQAAKTLPGVGLVQDEDIVRFVPTSTGSNTAGTYSMFLDGSTVGLTTKGEDIDAIGRTPDGRLIISTVGYVSSCQPG